ncbi:hypothetical protein Tco_1411472, partial [Tanacetum coccineum]
VVSPDASSPAENMPIESVVSNTVDFDDNATRAENSDLTVPAPVQFVIENTPELRGALLAEVHKLDVEKERTEDIVPGVASSETNTGLIVNGAVPDEIGASDNWWDMGRLNGFGGGGGFSVRKLYARAMAIVYEQHHITVLLDRTYDRALMHCLLLLLKKESEL